MVALAYLGTAGPVDATLAAGAAICLAGALAHVASRGMGWGLWGAAALLFTLGVVLRPIDVANHHYLVTYVTAAVALSLSGPADRRREHLRDNARWLLVGLWGFATLQKALSPEFLDASYLGYQLIRGEFGRPILDWLGEPSVTMQINDRAIATYRAVPPIGAGARGIALAAPFADVETLTRTFVVLVLASELWLFVVFLLWPHRWLAHVSLLAFALVLSVLRQELTFISVVCALGLATGPPGRWLRYGYAVTAVLFAAAGLFR